LLHDAGAFSGWRGHAIGLLDRIKGPLRGRNLGAAAPRCRVLAQIHDDMEEFHVLLDDRAVALRL
jgi:hypothetical protein